MLDKIEIALGKKEIDNGFLAEYFNTTEEEIFDSFGIKTRYGCSKDQTSLDVGREACELFFEKNPDLKDQVDSLIFVSEGFDYIAPNNSNILQDQLGLRKDTMCVDIRQGCNGFIQGLATAAAYLKGNISESVLLVTSDNPSLVIHEEDLELRSIFSDGATVMLITKADIDKIGAFVFGSDGSGYKNLIVDASGFRNGDDKYHKEEYKKLSNGRLRMNSFEIFRFSIKTVPSLVQKILERNNIEKEEIDYFIFHQASFALLDILRRRLKIDKEKFVINIESYGNTVSSTIPIALKELLEKNKTSGPLKIMIVGFGIGYNWGGTILKI